MGSKELIESLRREADETVQKCWDEAEAKAEDLKREARRQREAFLNAYRAKQSSLIKRKTDAILADSSNKARSIRLQEEAALLEKLYPLALSCLKQLRGDAYERYFEALVNEIPQTQWLTVKVSPTDTALAKKRFPDAEIISDVNISGGLEVFSSDGRVRVVNTFEKRLERVWTDLTLLVFKDIYEEAGLSNA